MCVRVCACAYVRTRAYVGMHTLVYMDERQEARQGRCSNSCPSASYPFATHVHLPLATHIHLPLIPSSFLPLPFCLLLVAGVKGGCRQGVMVLGRGNACVSG